MRTKSKKSILKKLGLFSGMSIIAALSAFLIASLTQYNANAHFENNKGYYKSTQAPIQTSGTAPVSEANRVTMTAAAGAPNTSYAGKIITIENATELETFTSICKTNTSFLAYSYKLIANIECTTSTALKPIGTSSNRFTGTFDGNGYEIRNLNLNLASNDTASYTDPYFALFVFNNGTITDLGLVSPKIVVSSATQTMGTTGGVAILAGENNGTIKNSYIIDDGNALEEEAGISAYDGARIATIAVNNTGTISNFYTAVSSVINPKLSDVIEFNNVVLQNSGTIGDCYFADKSIAVLTDPSSTATIVYESEYGFDTKTAPYYGTYVDITDDDKSNLITAVTGVDEDTEEAGKQNNWYVPANYGDYAANVGIKYALRRGLAYDNSTHTFTINNPKDYGYMYELFNNDDKMAAEGVKYLITQDINLAEIPVSSYSYKHVIACEISGISNYSGSQVTLMNTQTSTFPTIYNAALMDSSRIVVSTGVDCYGLFNYVSGKISNLNIIAGTDLSFDSIASSSNVKGVGILAGYIEGAEISNINVKGTIKNYTGNGDGIDVGEYYVGGICGVLGGNAAIDNVTTAGEIDMKSSSVTMPSTSSYMKCIAIGGVVGYIEASQGALYTCLNGMNISSKLGASVSYSIGGVIGAGYTKNYSSEIKTSKLDNVANITITDSSDLAYDALYVAGIIGRHLGESAQVMEFANNGNIAVKANGNTTFVSGVLNADIQTDGTNSTGMTASLLKNNAGKFIYYASGLTNGGEISVTGTDTNLQYTNVINVNATNGFQTTLSGIYNLAYNQKYAGESSKTQTTLTHQEIDMNTIHSFAPVLNVVGGAYNKVTNVQSAYNLRDIQYKMTSTIESNLTYTGLALGEYISYVDARNEGNLTFIVNDSITGNIKISGLFNELSAGMTANNLYNGGNINFGFTAIVTGNIYASGICYANRNGFSNDEISKYNPSSNDYDKSLTGSINNCINNGSVLITSTRFSEITYSSDNIIKSPNGQSNLGNTIDNTFNNPVYVDGNIYATGVVAVNESVITNTFNIADITAANYVTNTSKTCEISASGISVLNIGKYAYILNSANDGNIKAYNLSSGEGKLSETNAAGISCRNDKLENGNSYVANSNNPNSSQVISFTINYGSIYSYNYRYNFTSLVNEPNAKSSGILAMGLCNVINVVNYGNVYGSETASGIFGIVYYTKFTAEVSSDIYIANTLNYGNVYILERGYNHVHGSLYDDYEWIEYDTLMSLTITTASSYALTSVVRNTDYLSIIGSVFAIVNFANASNTDYIKIRYLISFDEDIAISGSITAYPLNADPDVSTFYSAHISMNASTGAYQTDGYMKNFVQYAPLISSQFSGSFVTNINPSTGIVSTQSKDFYGVFSSNFAFMKAIAGSSEYIDTTHYVTDIFISDYFEFIGAVYANSKLLDKIGWSSITYIAAAEAFATSLNDVSKFLAKLLVDNSTAYTNLIDNALQTDTWISRCDNSLLTELANTLIQNEDNPTLLEMIDYIFTSDSGSYSMITTTTRSQILTAILESEHPLSYATLLDNIITYTGGYSSLLADSILNSDDAGTYLQSYVNSLPNSTIESILTTYCNYLKEESSSTYFTYKNSEQLRYALLSSMFEKINDNTFYQDLAELIEIDTAIGESTISNVLRMYEAYSNLSNSDKIDLYKAILTNNTNNTSFNNIQTYLNKIANEIGYFNRLIENGYSKTSFANIQTDISYNESQTSETVIDERVALWNQIRRTDTFKNYIENLVTDTVYDLATEYNNTYQSVTEPHNAGTYVGDTSENRLTYMYTTQITPQVYFYGPYTSAGTSAVFNLSVNGTENGRKANDPIVNYRGLNVDSATSNADGRYKEKYFSLFHYTDDSLWNSNEVMKSRGGENSTLTYNVALNSTTYPYSEQTTYDYPVLDYYDYYNEQLGGANTQYTVTDDFYVSGQSSVGDTFWGFGRGDTKAYDQFDYSKSFADPILGGSYKTNDWTGTTCGTNDLYMYVSSTGETFSLNGGAIIRAFNTGGKKDITLANGITIKTNDYRFYVRDNTGAFHLVQTGSNNSYDENATIQIGRMVNGSFTPIHILKKYNTVELTRKIYSFITYVAGQRMYTSTVSPSYHSTGRTGIYRSSGQWYNYFTWKQDKKTRVFTSQYIDYSIDDLLNLDGYLTQYGDGTYKSTDERNIINRIFNDYLVNDGSNFMKAVATALLERNMYDSNYQVDINYIDNFFITNIYSGTIISSNKKPFEYLYYNFSSTPKITVLNYLVGLTSNNPNYKTKFIAYCASNHAAYAKLVLELIKLNADEFSISSILARGLGSSTDPGALSITNVSSYDDVTIVEQSANINNESFTYGVKFDEMTFTLDSSWKKIYIYSIPTNSSVTLNVKLDSDTTGTDYTITTSDNNYLEVSLNNNSSITLTSNNDLVLHKVMIDYNEDVTSNQASSYTFNYSNNSSSYTIPTSNALQQSIDNQLTQDGIRHSDISISSVQIEMEGKNDTGSAQTLGIGTSTSNSDIILDRDFIRYETAYFDAITGTSYLGKTLNIYYQTWSFLVTRWGSDSSYIITNCRITVNFTYQKTESVNRNHVLFDNSSIETLIQNSQTKEDDCNKTLDESTGYAAKYQKMIKDALYGLIPIDYSSVLSNPTHTGKASKNIIEILGLSETHTNDIIPEYCVPDFLNIFITSSNSAFKSFVDDTISSSEYRKDYYQIILSKLVETLSYYPLGDAIEGATDLTDTSRRKIAAAYLVADYKYILNNNIDIKNSKLKTYVEYLNSDYHYIYVDKTVGKYSESKFIAFSGYIGYDLSTSGYGIYALASNQGKLNGQFIPDNLDITKMDVPYMVEDGVLTLQGSNQNEWRGGKTVAHNDTSSVNYAFYKDMKQVEESISTTVFELDIQYGSDVLYGDVNLDDRTVTYYVSQLTPGNYSIVNQKYASKAESNIGSSISVIANSSSGDVQKEFIVTAENQNVHAEYRVIFVVLSTSYTLKYEDNSTTKNYAEDTQNCGYDIITLKLHSPNDTGVKLPKGLNLKPYISFINKDSNVTYNMSSSHLILSALSTDHKVDKNGDATITIVVSNSLPYGTYWISVDICGATAHVEYTKAPNTGNSIISGELDGYDIVNGTTTTGVRSPFAYSSAESAYVGTAQILYGRAYNYDDLTKPYILTTDTEVNDNKTYYTQNGTDGSYSYTQVTNPIDSDIANYYEANSNFYLHNFKVSNNATVKITATNNTIDASNGLMTYVITFDVTSESGSTRVYKHKVSEKPYFNNGDTYADIFAEGAIVRTTNSYSSISQENMPRYVHYGTLTYNLGDDHYNSDENSWSLTDNMYAQISFNRKDSAGNVIEPQYRIKYKLNNFYILAENYDSYTTSSGYTLDEIGIVEKRAAISKSYAGLTLTVSENNDTGVYYFIYTYTNTGVWSDGSTYTRYYEFPELRIEKLESTDALLHQLTFLEESIILGNTATVIKPTDVIIPDRTGPDGTYTEDDVTYTSEFNTQPSDRLVNVTTSEIDYGTDGSDTSIIDYYAIGTVSEADLSYYCPKFKIDTYAEMYQYTTREKLKHYGMGNQTAPDSDILSNHNASNTMYLYVPFMVSNKVEIMLVELDSNRRWTKVYTDEFNVDNASSTLVHTYTGTLPTTKTKSSANATFTEGGKTYTVASFAGNATGNQSLYMDYIGTPLDGHFWYVSYVVFSEDWLAGNTSVGNIRYYHISIIDATNNVQFNVTIYATVELDIDDLYLTFTENIYKESNNVNVYQSTRQISAYGDNKGTYSGPKLYHVVGNTKTEVSINGYYVYKLRYTLQTLPGGYFKFLLELPNGFSATAYTNKANKLGSDNTIKPTMVNGESTAMTIAEEGAYLPYTSIITTKIDLVIVIDESTDINAQAWAVNTASLFTREATYVGMFEYDED